MKNTPLMPIKCFIALYETYEEANQVLRDIIEAAFYSPVAGDWSAEERVNLFCFYCCLSDLLQALFSTDTIFEN